MPSACDLCLRRRRQGAVAGRLARGLRGDGRLTATFGGIIRDVLAGVPSILLSRELYITPAIVSSAVFVSLRTLGFDWALASAIAVAFGFAVRGGAIIWKWSLPEFKPPRDGRSPDQSSRTVFSLRS